MPGEEGTQEGPIGDQAERGATAGEGDEDEQAEVGQEVLYVALIPRS